jgi:hypothetical protein
VGGDSKELVPGELKGGKGRWMGSARLERDKQLSIQGGAASYKYLCNTCGEDTAVISKL